MASGYHTGSSYKWGNRGSESVSSLYSRLQTWHWIPPWLAPMLCLWLCVHLQWPKSSKEANFIRNSIDFLYIVYMWIQELAFVMYLPFPFQSKSTSSSFPLPKLFFANITSCEKFQHFLCLPLLAFCLTIHPEGPGNLNISFFGEIFKF